MTHPNCKNPVDTEARPPSLNIAIAKLMLDGRERTAADMRVALAGSPHLGGLPASLNAMTKMSLLSRSQVDAVSVYRAAKFVGRGKM